jgi:quercetin dioxygenase-like cupin family protein
MELVPLTARYVAPGAGQRYWVIDNLITVKAIAAETGGAYSLFEVRAAPGYGTPLHLHRYEDTTLFVLDGTVTVRVGDRTIELDPGGYAFLPREMPHAYTNPGTLPARLLVMVSPGGVSELFIAEVGQRAGHPAVLPGPDGPPDSAWIGIAAEKYGIEVLPPAGF